MDLPSVENADVDSRRVIVRCDFDIPLESGKIIDDSRLLPSISTIEYLLENNASVVAIGHLGRPKRQFTIDNLRLTKEEQELSLYPIVKWFSEQLGRKTNEIEEGGVRGWELGDDLLFLENLRFYAGEIGRDPEFARKLAEFGDIYVNEAFGCSHRQHASMYALPALLPHYAGFHLQKEIKILSRIFSDPKRPLTIVIGGAKIETKLPLVQKMQALADHILIGGAIAGEYAPIDSLPNIVVAELNSEKTDIAVDSLRKFKEIIQKSGMVVWNGPMGVIDQKLDEDSSLSTIRLAEAIIASPAYKIVGGGDTIAFLGKHHLLDKFDFASVGGGAMLKFLSGEELPGIAILQK